MRKLIRFFLILLLLAGVLLIYSRYIEPSILITKEYNINTKKIDDSFDGLKIVHFSDLHYLRVTDKEYTKKIVDEINLINPDIVFFTGDLIDKDYKLKDKDKNDLISLLSQINAKYTKYAIIGNHDYVKDEEELKEIYESSNFILLQNEYDIITNNNDKLFIGGLDTYSFKKADIDKVMEYFKDNDDINYKIILVHEPDYADIITKDYKVNLILSGHSHNGQINIPGIKELLLPYGCKKYYGNYYKIDNTKLYVSSGIGFSRIDFRFLNPPSINFYRINKITD